jgi:regulator of replication initiation timing
MNNYLQQEQGHEQKSQRKRGTGAKLFMGAAAVGTGAYYAGRKIWKHFYPPTFKKYFATAVMATTLLCVKNCATINKGISSTYHEITNSITTRIERTPRINSLEVRVAELMASNKLLEKDNNELRESLEKKTYAVQTELEKQLKEKKSVLDDTKKYIIELEKDYFNYKNSIKADPKKAGRLIQVKAPPKAAFQDFLLHKKDYNVIVYKIDKALQVQDER